MLKNIPLFGSGVTAYSAHVTRQRRLNMMYDMRLDQDRAGVVAVNTPGCTAFVTIPESPVRGWRVVAGVLYVVAGRSLYTVSSSGTVTLLGALPTVTAKRYVSMADTLTQIGIVDGTAGYVVTVSNGAIATITDSNFPNGATSITALDSSFVVNVPNTRQFAVSTNKLDGMTWSPYVVGTKENYSDALLAVEAYNGILALFGAASFEQWQDVGSSPNPFQRINAGTYQWGLAAYYSRVEVGNSIIFLGLNPDGGVKVVQLAGGQLTPISTGDIEAAIAKMGTISDAVGMNYAAYGHSVYQITFPTANRSFAYDLTTKIWHEAQTGNAVQARHMGQLGIAFGRLSLMADATSGVIYQLDTTIYNDNGQVIPREICTRHLRVDGNKFSVNELFLDIETGVGNTAAPNPQVSVSISKDGGNTFGTDRVKPLGGVGQYMNKVRFLRFGQSKDAVFRIRTTDPVKFVLAGGSAEVEV